MARFSRDDAALTASYFATDATSFVERADVDELKGLAIAESGPARYSLHASPASTLHSMVILQPFGTYAQPRKHLTKAKLFHIVDGEMVVVIFEESGTVRAVHRMGAEDVLIVHVEPDCYHTNMALTPQAIYHEVITGPFDRGSTDRVFAEFAPSDREQERGLEFVRAAVASLRSDIRLD
ncbi:MAG: WbuC family cupin fold metalloprotein [Actinomycetota bacterium]|nr:WbuC family cupin fold metalloprotein [Actinomycetota bacterium]